MWKRQKEEVKEIKPEKVKPKNICVEDLFGEDLFGEDCYFILKNNQGTWEIIRGKIWGAVKKYLEPLQIIVRYKSYFITDEKNGTEYIVPREHVFFDFFTARKDAEDYLLKHFCQNCRHEIDQPKEPSTHGN